MAQTEKCGSLRNSLTSQNIVKNLMKQKADGMFCDVKFCFGGSVTWGHACVMAPFSSYIMHRFGQSSGNHWCSTQPLVINMDILLTATCDKCTSCLSALVDFMYLQDLIIVDGHFEHFSEMVHCLEVADLIPLFRKYLCENVIGLFSKQPNVEEFSAVFTSDVKLVKEVENSVQEKALTLATTENSSVDSVQTDTVEITDSYETLIEKTIETKKQLCSSLGFDADFEDSKKQEAFSENSNVSSSLIYTSHSVSDKSDVIAQEHSYGSKEGTYLQPKCGFLCCSGETLSSTTSKNNRRKINCEMCSFTAVSVKKVLKHFENFNHLGTFCPICTLTFSSKEGLIDHLGDHKDSKPFLCHFCKKRSRFFDFYKLHLKVHCKNKSIICEICKKSFNRKENLQVHLKSHKENFLCSSCNYLTSDAETFKSHLLIHEEKDLNTSNKQNSFERYKCLLDSDLTKHRTAKRFLCNLCEEGFTQKSNLKRHIELKHNNVRNYGCSKCNYLTKRTDLLRSHMLKHHKCVAEEIESLIPKTKKIRSKKHEQNNVNKKKDQSEIVGVLIPVQLVSTNDSSTLNAYAIKSCLDGEPEIKEGNLRNKLESELGTEKSIQFSINDKSTFVLNEHSQPRNFIGNISSIENNSKTGGLENFNSVPCEVYCSLEKENSDSLLNDNDLYLKTEFSDKEQNIDISKSNVELHLNASLDTNTDLTQPVLDLPQDLKSFQVALENGNRNVNIVQDETSIPANGGEFWLNETTGEFLIGNNVLNLQIVDKSCISNNVSSTEDNPRQDIVDSPHTLILNESSKTVSIYDLRNEVDEFQSNPQTPSTNVVEVDDPDNLFSWSCIDSSFCSTWILNEATGELNMVSFNVQAMKNSDELKLDEKSGTMSTTDDDETALFLNEGTGDLSVIYFNPSKEECDNSRQLYNDQGIQDAHDNVSEHSNDEDDFLNEEFFKATASFMAHKENETFLNELTGEFNTTIADFNNYHTELLENQISPSESYLNEETGEILLNALNINDVSDFFANTDSFKYDLDDSLNCDDLEPFVDEMNDFSSKFCLENTQDWQPVDETSEILLNECTGELVKKS